MKSSIVQEISKISTNDSEKDSTDGISNNQPSLPQSDYPSNIENYFVLLKALYENSSLLNRIKGMGEQSCEKKFESFKENIVANQLNNNSNSNQQQQHTQRKNIKNDSDNSIKDASKAVGGERSLGNIIINSLDVAINAAGKPSCNYGDVDKRRVSCSTTPVKTVSLPLTSPDSQQLVTSSSSEPGDEDDTLFNRPITSSSLSSKNENNNLASHNVNDCGPTRAVYSNRVEISKTVPDDIAFDYHNIKYYDDDDKRTSSTTCNGHSTKYPNGADDAGDYHTKSISSIDTAKCNKQNNSTSDIKPITSTYLLMTRSMGLTDEDALNLVSEAFSIIFLKGFYAHV